MEMVKKVLGDVKTNWKKYVIGAGIGVGATFATLKLTGKI